MISFRPSNTAASFDYIARQYHCSSTKGPPFYGTNPPPPHHSREELMSTTSERAKRQSIIDACLQMNKMGINQGTSGNISLRHRDGMLITPTGTPYEAMKPEHIVFMKIDGTVDTKQRPSSEWRFHRDILEVRPEVNAIVHAHPPYATMLAIMGKEIPPIHYMIACAGGDTIRCAPYATFGTEQLSKHAVAALQDRSACLLAHHGMIAIGPSLSRAMWLAIEVETLARQYHGCLQIGTPSLLSKNEIENVRARMAGYGPGDSRD
jgi:L-fuculose-phosphate aldolase